LTGPAPHRDFCPGCGTSRSGDPGRCSRACQFIASDYPRLEAQAHGHSRISGQGDELHLFARAWVEVKAIKTIIHLLREEPARIKSMVPTYVWSWLEPYGIDPYFGECPGQTAAASKSLAR